MTAASTMRRLGGLLAILVAICSAQVAQQQQQQQPQIPPPPAITCRGIADGIYVRDATACSDSFYKCANGRQFFYKCPAGLFFSVEDARCEYKTTITACGGKRQKAPPQVVAPAVAQALVAPAVPAQRMPPIYPISASYSSIVGSTPQAAAVDSYGQQQTPVAAASEYIAPYAPAPIAVVPAQPSYVAPAIAVETPVAVVDAAASYETVQPVAVGTSGASYGAASYGAAAPVAIQQQQQQQFSASNVVLAAPAAAVVPIAVATSPRPRVDFNCASRGDGYYVKRPCTSVYYHCLAGIAQQMRCPADLRYDTALARCEHAEQCGRPQPPTTTTRAPPTTPRSTQCDGRADGFHEYGRCLPRYLQCSNGIAHPRVCTGNLLFRNDSCVHANDCFNPTRPAPIAIARPTPPSSSWCAQHGKSEGTFANGCSHKYFVCNAGRTSEMSCASNLFYDPILGSCDQRSFIAACGGFRPPVTTTIAAPVAVGAPQFFNCGSRPDGVHVNGCSSSYFSCNGGVGTPISCPANLRYSVATGACDYPQHVPECGGRLPTATIATPIAVQQQQQQSGYSAASSTDYQQQQSTSYEQPAAPVAAVIEKPTSNYGAYGAAQAALAPVAAAVAESAVHAQPQQYGNTYQEQPAPQAVVAPAYETPVAAAANYETTSYEQPAYAPTIETPVAAEQAVQSYEQPTPIAPKQPQYGGSYAQQQAPIAVAAQQSSSQYEAPIPQAVQSYGGGYEAPAQQQYQAAEQYGQSYEQPVAAAVESSASYGESAAYDQQTVAAVAPASTGHSSSSSYGSTSSSYGASSGGSSSSVGIVAPMAVAPDTEEDANPCAQLTDGIYGRRCTRHYFVCSGNKTYEFTCPTGYAYDRQLARCGAVSGIAMCSGAVPVV